MPLEWVGLAQTFANLGFFGVTAWLLTERRLLDRDRAARDATMASALQQQAVATTRLAEAVDNLKTDLRDFTQEARLRHAVVKRFEEDG